MEPYFPNCHPNDLRAMAAQLGETPDPDRRALAVKLGEAADQMEQDHSRGLGASSFDWKSLMSMVLVVLQQFLNPPAPK